MRGPSRTKRTITDLQPLLLRERAVEVTEGNKEDLQAALDWIAEHQQKTNEETPHGKEEEQETMEEGPKALKCNDCGKTFASVAMAQWHATRSGHQDFSEAESVNLTPEERATRLAQLKERLAEKRRQDQIVAEQEARQTELIRRKSGQMATEARRELAEREIRQAAEQLRRDREEERQIRARIRAEMEEERRRKQERSQMSKSKEMPPPPEPIHLTSQAADVVRIQVKFSDGRETLRATFKPDDKLSLLRERIGDVPPGSQLTIPFPHTIIDLDADGGRTFGELGLCPSASLLLSNK